MQPDNPHTPPYAPPVQGGQPPYVPPVQGGQPPYGAPPAPYLTTTDAGREARERKGKRDIGFGVVWIVAGLLITVVTLASDSPVVVVAWGPVLYGLFLIIRGAIAVSRNRS
jgi:hypothetical protein